MHPVGCPELTAIVLMPFHAFFIQKIRCHLCRCGLVSALLLGPAIGTAQNSAGSERSNGQITAQRLPVPSQPIQNASTTDQPNLLDASEALPNLTKLPVRMTSNNRPLAELQRQMESALGIRLILTGGLNEMLVTGEFAGNNGLAFVRDLARKLRLEWAIGREGIYLSSAAEIRTMTFTASKSSAARRVAVLANQEFQNLGSGIRVVAKRKEIEVTGIPAWLNQIASLRVPVIVDFVQRTMAKPHPAAAARPQAPGVAATVATTEAATAPPLASPLPPTTEPLSMMVFRLNNAYVDDKQLTVGSNQVRIAGVASLFRQFTGLGSSQSDGSGSFSSATGTGISRVARLDTLAGGRNVNGREQDSSIVFTPNRPLDPVSSAIAANQPAVIADARMNALIVRDRASLQESYRKLVEVLDQAADMVQLDAFVIDIKASRIDEFGLGLSWASKSPNSATQAADGFSQLTRQFLPGGSVVAGANVILQASRGAQLLANIRALESNGDTEVLTVPSVVTLNNLEATFSARQSFFVKVSGNQDASLTRVTAETLLKVTPLVAQTGGQTGNDRRIRLLISIQDGSIDASTSAVVDNLPRTLENQISTQAVVRGGDTLVIGGQVVRKRINRNSGVPILQDLPIFGALARSRTDEFEQFVRIYVVRPRLLGEDSSQLSGPLGPEGPDANSHRVLDRVPDLIRGSGLTPRRSDLSIDVPNPKNEGPLNLDSDTPAMAPLVVPVPAAIVPLVPSKEDTRQESASSRNQKERKDSDSDSEEDTQEWNPNDPQWRPPGTPFGTSDAQNAPAKGSGLSPPLKTPPAVSPSPSSNNRSETGSSSGQALRDQEARRIIEAELQRTDKAVARLSQEVAQGGALAEPALARAQRDQASLRSELKRLDNSSK
jgi:type II secretory pathway component GspD/PulD (secretin)